MFDTFPVPTFACLHCGRRMPLQYQAGSSCVWCTGGGPIVERCHAGILSDRQADGKGVRYRTNTSSCAATGASE
jgi:hypothetical protein